MCVCVCVCVCVCIKCMCSPHWFHCHNSSVRCLTSSKNRILNKTLSQLEIEYY